MPACSSGANCGPVWLGGVRKVTSTVPPATVRLKCSLALSNELRSDVLSVDGVVTPGVVAPNVPSISATPPNRVEDATRLISVDSAEISACAAALEAASLPPELAACTDRSRIRFNIVCTSLSAPSAVCTTEMPSSALRVACFSPLTWARSPCEITSPAASSAARLMRKPDDSFSKLLPSCRFVPARLREALFAITF